MKHRQLTNLILSAIFLSVALLLPFLTAQIPEIGSMLSPMHIPVLICGFVCGWKYGGIVGFIAPLLRSMLFGMPPIFPVAIAMAFELLAYGILAGILYQVLPKNYGTLYLSLILSMVGGRVVWGGVMAMISTIFGFPFTFEAFLAGGFIKAVPGIILHIAIVPPIVYAINRARNKSSTMGTV